MDGLNLDEERSSAEGGKLQENLKQNEEMLNARLAR
jgi:hypothetical protein